ncbi:MAG: hypothetical protein HY308_05125 [Gammaproteobacteria bacterium]|nr:hypothetical protein [Gammaproteobacteria bacterium]
MTHTYEELKHKTVAELREIAAGVQHEAVQGYTQLHKDQLLPGLCKALGIEAHAHHHVVGIDKTAIKSKIRLLKARRDEILASDDHKPLGDVLRKIHSLKRALHRATV